MNPYNHLPPDPKENPDTPLPKEQTSSHAAPAGRRLPEFQQQQAPITTVEEVANSANVSVKKARTVMDTLKQFASVSEVLRIVGAAVMVGALSLFMMQGWLEGNDIQRYLKLLAQTLLLTAGGFGLSAWLKENKGARLFFGLGLASVAANFTILGALIYSVFQLDGLLGSYPQYAAWVSQSPGQVLGLTALALALLVPVTRLAFSVLARPAAKWLTTTYLLGGALLLIPVRGSVWSCVLAAGFIAFVIYTLNKHRNTERSPGTTESAFSALMLFIPPVILCVRSFYFYQIEALAFACMSGAAFLLLRHLSLRSSNLNVQRVLDTLCLPLAYTTAASLLIGVPGIPSSLDLPIFAFMLMPLVGELTLRRPDTTRSAIFGALGAVAICSALMLNEALYSGFGVAFAGIAGSVLVILAGYWLKQIALTFFGCVSALFIAFDNAMKFFQWFNVNNWVLLSLLGAGAIILASLLDRYGARLKLKLDALRANYANA